MSVERAIKYDDIKIYVPKMVCPWGNCINNAFAERIRRGVTDDI